jgi:hypothetical protein
LNLQSALAEVQRLREENVRLWRLLKFPAACNSFAPFSGAGQSLEEEALAAAVIASIRIGNKLRQAFLRLLLEKRPNVTVLFRQHALQFYFLFSGVLEKVGQETRSHVRAAAG